MADKIDGVPSDHVEVFEVELYDDDDPLPDDMVEIPFFETAEQFLEWRKKKIEK